MSTPTTQTQKEPFDAFDAVEDKGEIPPAVLNNIARHSRFIWWSLVFLNGATLWAYYSCLSAQNYYDARFKEADFNFAYLTTPATTWPMFVGHALQLVFGWDKKLGMWKRVMIGFPLFIVAALIILAQEAFSTSANTGAIMVLFSFVLVGFTNTITEAAFYALSALFPDSTFTTAVQIGNGTSGIINITLNTIIRLLVGGTTPAAKDGERINSVSFYIFFSILIVVCVAAMVVFAKLIKLDGVKYLLDRNTAETARRVTSHETLGQHLGRLGRIFNVIVLPFSALFIVFLCSLTVFPGIGCSAGFQYAAGANWANWYCSPGVIATYNYGDFVGRLLAPLLLARINMTTCFTLSWVRWVFLILLLIGMPGTDPVTKASPSNPLFAFGGAHAFGEFWELALYVLVGLTNGILSTVAFALGPQLVAQEDRESAGALMCLALFFGISSGATVGWQFGERHWFGA
ncbi:Aste57867_3151 [Aphanomyces stellatus]|uniref:Aste57867_3151 protein n=1 Tax=Aphanomyces stellatus TaxID=120398 RepID=A0A485KAR9_9STRA|nr:hypothetical protein As57867_003142 [Aphanomyces stellatus]VFT80325.1 Aste57867_3151 [Aphanomyces stellatus]